MGKTVRRESYKELYDDFDDNYNRSKSGERSTKKRNTLKHPFKNVQYQGDEDYDIEDYRDYF